MFCFKCGCELPEGSLACYKCGIQFISLQDRVMETQAELIKIKQPQVKKSDSFGEHLLKGIAGVFIISLACSLVIIVWLGITVTYPAFGSFEPASNKNISNRSTNQPTYIEQNTRLETELPQSRTEEKEQQVVTETIVDSSDAVEANSYIYFEFELTEQSRVYGKFEAQGGSNDINCMLVDADQLVNVENGNAGRAFYESQYTTRGKIDKTLPKGNYVLIFDNRKALMTNKIVTAKIFSEATR